MRQYRISFCGTTHRVSQMSIVCASTRPITEEFSDDFMYAVWRVVRDRLDPEQAKMWNRVGLAELRSLIVVAPPTNGFAMPYRLSVQQRLRRVFGWLHQPSRNGMLIITPRVSGTWRVMDSVTRAFVDVEVNLVRPNSLKLLEYGQMIDTYASERK